MRRAALPVFCVLTILVATLVFSPLLSQPVAADIAIDDPTEPILVYDIAVDENGTAAWNITARFPTATEDEQAAFETLAEEYTNDETDEYLAVGPYQVVADDLEEELGREMRISEDQRSVIRTDGVGMLQLTFRWEGFAEADNESVRVGDVFTTTDQPWLSTLRDNEYLRIEAPPEYASQTSGLPVQNGTAWVDGPADLSADNLAAVFVPEADSDDGDDDGGPIIDDENSEQPWWVPAFGGALGLLGLAGAFLLGGYVMGWAPIGAAVAAVRSDERDEVEEEPVPAVAEEPEPAASPEDLLSDEERVLTLIEQNGGRMKQAAIVTETDWSNAKVSQLLSEMSEDGEIEKLRIGRENLISFPDYENGN